MGVQISPSAPHPSDANLVATIRRGREKLHYLNPIPIHEIYERWIEKYEQQPLDALRDLKKRAEGDHHVDETHEERHTRVTFEIEPVGSVVRLTVAHDRLEPNSEMLRGITAGWPKVLSSLKSLLEVGRPLPELW